MDNQTYQEFEKYITEKKKKYSVGGVDVKYEDDGETVAVDVSVQLRIRSGLFDQKELNKVLSNVSDLLLGYEESN